MIINIFVHIILFVFFCTIIISCYLFFNHNIHYFLHFNKTVYLFNITLRLLLKKSYKNSYIVYFSNI